MCFSRQPFSCRGIWFYDSTVWIFHVFHLFDHQRLWSLYIYLFIFLLFLSSTWSALVWHQSSHLSPHQALCRIVFKGTCRISEYFCIQPSIALCFVPVLEPCFHLILAILIAIWALPLDWLRHFGVVMFTIIRFIGKLHKSQYVDWASLPQFWMFEIFKSVWWLLRWCPRDCLVPRSLNNSLQWGGS